VDDETGNSSEATERLALTRKPLGFAQLPKPWSEMTDDEKRALCHSIFGQMKTSYEASKAAGDKDDRESS